LEGQTEERPDEDDQSQCQHVLYRGRHNDRTDDVTCDKELEPEQNCAPDILPVKRILIAGVLNAMKHKPRSCNECATHNDKYTYAIHAGANDVHHVPKIFHNQLC
jgi:hypothetical protein